MIHETAVFIVFGGGYMLDSVYIHFGPLPLRSFYYQGPKWISSSVLFLVRSLSTSVLSTDLDIHFGPLSLRSFASSVLFTDLILKCSRLAAAAERSYSLKHVTSWLNRLYRDVVSVSTSRSRDGLQSRRTNISSRSRRNTSRLGSRTISSRRDVLCRCVPCIAAVRPMWCAWRELDERTSWARRVSFVVM